MLTNWKTISASIQRLRKLDEQLGGGANGLTKKERLMLSREREKLEKALGGIKDMGGAPDLIFVIDTNKERWRSRSQPARHSGRRHPRHQLGPDGIAFPVPANDDAGRAIALYCDLVARAAIDGISRSQGAPASIWARRRRRSPSRCQRLTRGRPRGFADGRIRTPVRAARRPGRSRQAHRSRAADRQKA